jgi:hypothetical protein
MRRLILTALCALPLAACATTGARTPEKLAVDAVVLDEGQRAKAAATANATASSSDAMAKVSDGPKDQKPTPP